MCNLTSDVFYSYFNELAVKKISRNSLKLKQWTDDLQVTTELLYLKLCVNKNVTLVKHYNSAFVRTSLMYD